MKDTLAEDYRKFCQWVLAESNNADSTVHTTGLCESLWRWGVLVRMNLDSRCEILDYQTALFEAAGLDRVFPWNSGPADFNKVLLAGKSLQGACLQWVKDHA